MKKYASDYKRSDSGYEYSGSRYFISIPAGELKKKAKVDMISLAAASLFFLSGVFQNNEGTRTLWILLPFVGTFLPVIYGWMGAWALLTCAKGERSREGWMRRMDYDRGIRRPRRCGALLAVLGFVAFVGELVLMVTGGESQVLLEEAPLLMASAGILAVGIFLFWRSRKIERKILYEVS